MLSGLDSYLKVQELDVQTLTWRWQLSRCQSNQHFSNCSGCILHSFVCHHLWTNIYWKYYLFILIWVYNTWKFLCEVATFHLYGTLSENAQNHKDWKEPELLRGSHRQRWWNLKTLKHEWYDEQQSIKEIYHFSVAIFCPPTAKIYRTSPDLVIFSTK